MFQSTMSDDVTSFGPETSLNWLKDVIMTRYEIKYGGVLGPDKDDLKDVSILHLRSRSSPRADLVARVRRPWR